jgi:predicted dienelactone hydrolase
MRLLSALVFVVALMALPAQAAVGFQHFTIPDPHGQPMEVGVWYPTDAPPRTERLELGTQTVANDAPVKGDHLPMILMSHGHGGSYAGHADTAIALAKAGFVAAAVTHNGDSWQDASRAVEIWERPRQLKVLADYMLTDWAAHGRIDPHRIGAFGFSAGGFTVLMLAGGEPDMKRLAPHCRDYPAFEDCRVAAQAKNLDLDRKVEWTHDPRVRAIVSAAPGLGFAFGREGLAKVRAPVQLWRGADDPVLPHPFYAEAVRQDLPVPPEMHVVPHAGHYDFISPCPPKMAERLPEICVSEPGFDRTAFHDRFNRAVVKFFRRTLG